MRPTEQFGNSFTRSQEGVSTNRASQGNFLCILCPFLVCGFAGAGLSLASFVIEMKGGRVMGRVMRWLIVLMLVAVLPAGAVRAGDSPVAKAARADDLAAVRKLIT